MLLASVFSVLLLFGVCRGLPQFGLVFGISESPHIGPRLRFTRSYALQPEVALDWSIGEVIGCEIGLTNLFYLPRERSKVEDYAVGGLPWGHVSKHYHRSARYGGSRLRNLG